MSVGSGFIEVGSWGGIMLVPKQEKFVQYYLELGTVKAASLASGYGERGGSRLMKMPAVRHEIDRLKRVSMNRAEVTAADLVRVTWKIAKDEQNAPAARVSALQLLAKRHVEFSEKFEIKWDMVQQQQALDKIAGMSQDEIRMLADVARSNSAIPIAFEESK